MRREIAASMQAMDFWRNARTPTINFRSATPPPIGISELVHPPLYYVLLALFQPLAAHQGVEAQLYLTRLGSILLSLVVVVSAFGLVAEVSPKGRMLPVAVAAFIALLPHFTDLMSAVNNDVGAAAACSLLLWTSIRLVRRGLTLGRAVVVLLLAGACFTIKSTASLVAITVLLAVGGGYLLRRVRAPVQRRWFWLGLALLVSAILVAACNWGGYAAYWEAREPPHAASRATADAVLGRAALIVAAEDERLPRALFQELPLSSGRDLRGQTATLGTWLRAVEGAGGLVELGLDDGSSQQWYQAEATGDWRFHAFAATIGPDALSVAVHVRLPGDGTGAREVLLDGIILAEGELPAATPPSFDTVWARAGVWDSVRFENLIRNGSAETQWPSLRSWIGDKQLPHYPATYVLHSLWDWERTGWIYGPELRILAQSFWGRFGWNHLGLPEVLFPVLILLTLAGVAGAGLKLVRWARRDKGRPPWQVHACAVLGLALLAGWGGAAMRIHPVFVIGHILWPVARYAAVVIVPTAMLLCVGWAELVPSRWLRKAVWVGLLGLLTLDVLALWIVILPYYYG
jgi:hypothetical protein